MNLSLPPGLEQDVARLGAIIAALMVELERTEAELLLAEAVLSHHQHDYTRDVTGKPTTFTPATHTHSYASSTHMHSYQDYQYTSKGGDTTRQTGGPV
jgi:hypothetical protein